jgi:hypothetical protein
VRIERYPNETTLEALETHGACNEGNRIDAILWVAVLFLASEVDSLRDQLNQKSTS